MAEWGDFWSEEWGGALAQILSHEADAVDRLKFHLDSKPNAENLVTIFADRWQQFENVVSDLFTLFDIDNAFGDIQDKLGSLFNLSRAGFLDDDYATFLRAKAQVLLPKRRTLPGLLELVRALLGPKSLAALGSPIFHPNMATLFDPQKQLQGVATGTAYVAATDARDFERDDGDFIEWGSIGLTSPAPSTVSCRIRLESIGNQQIIFARQHLGDLGLVIQVNAANQIELFHDGATDKRRITTTTLTAGVDVHIVVTDDGTDAAVGVTIYIDGFPEAVYSMTQNGVALEAAVGVTRLGDSDGVAAPELDGLVSDVRVYDRVVNANEAQELFRGGKRFIGYSETFPKSYQLIIEGITAQEESVFREFLRVSRPATYNGYALIIPDPAFGYDDSTATVATTVQGFENASAPPLFGGPYAHVLLFS